MGKSDKKVKSERINALRKQYDAFLEDDKKRKERNEYILEKLDNMRYCTAMVPVRQKPSVLSDNRKYSFFNTTEKELDSAIGLAQRFDQTDTQRKRVDETILLQEISKKYILIPKLRSNDNNELTRLNSLTQKAQPKIDDNADWKSKYEILNKLKRDEKEPDNATREKSIESFIDTVTPNRDEEVSNYYLKNDFTNDEEPFSEYTNELPVKLQPEKELPYESNDYSKNEAVMEESYLYGNQMDVTNQNINQHNADTNFDDQGNTQSTVFDHNNVQNMSYDQNEQNIVYDRVNDDKTTYDHIPLKDKNLEYQTTTAHNLNSDDYAFHAEDQLMQPLDTNMITSETAGEIYPSNEITAESESHEQFVPKEEENNNTLEMNECTYLEPQEVVPVQHTNASDTDYEVHNAMPPENESMMFTNATEYPVEAINTEDLTTKESVNLEHSVNIDDPKPEGLVESNDISHHYDPVQENDNIPTDTPNIQDGEVLYNEHPENYNYTQEGATENYNTEYSAPVENYQQNEEYAYYEGAPTENAEINENQEIPQQYDQNYEQQYGTAYDQQAYEQQGYQQEYEQGYDQQGYIEPQQQYEAVEQGPQDPQYENQDNFTPQYVEQQLDNEEGYIGNTNEITAESNNVQPAESQQIAAPDQMQ